MVTSPGMSIASVIWRTSAVWAVIRPPSTCCSITMARKSLMRSPYAGPLAGGCRAGSRRDESVEDFGALGKRAARVELQGRIPQGGERDALRPRTVGDASDSQLLQPPGGGGSRPRDDAEPALAEAADEPFDRSLVEPAGDEDAG